MPEKMPEKLTTTACFIHRGAGRSIIGGGGHIFIYSCSA